MKRNGATGGSMLTTERMKAHLSAKSQILYINCYEPRKSDVYMFRSVDFA